jgi:hypothetical protein
MRSQSWRIQEAKMPNLQSQVNNKYSTWAVWVKYGSGCKESIIRCKAILDGHHGGRLVAFLPKEPHSCRKDPIPELSWISVVFASHCRDHNFSSFPPRGLSKTKNQNRKEIIGRFSYQINDSVQDMSETAH